MTCSLFTEARIAVVPILIYILALPNWNLDPQTGYPGWRFSWLYSKPSDPIVTPSFKIRYNHIIPDSSSFHSTVCNIGPAQLTNYGLMNHVNQWTQGLLPLTYLTITKLVHASYVIA
jgi:hypothetical protein